MSGHTTAAAAAAAAAALIAPAVPHPAISLATTTPILPSHHLFLLALKFHRLGYCSSKARLHYCFLALRLMREMVSPAR
jgi:hypothetical protein